eukprot:Awhi_evm1s15618
MEACSNKLSVALNHNSFLAHIVNFTSSWVLLDDVLLELPPGNVGAFLLLKFSVFLYFISKFLGIFSGIGFSLWMFLSFCLSSMLWRLGFREVSFDVDEDDIVAQNNENENHIDINNNENRFE